ncbi:MAG: BamA/TamA family outer membrane protein [Aureispira sp.]|nr:BamA/TamA family outer membrane protein [Aureispira sp.]
MRGIIILLFSFFCTFQATGQTKKVCIKSIVIEGNKKTKASTILNELTFSVGDSLLLKDLMPAMELNERYVMNTWLFTMVRMNVAQWKGADVDIKIAVKESWYIYPIPVFELADRNFSVWSKRYKNDIRRTNIGLWLIWRNISGRNDLLKAIAQFGFTQKYEVDYALPPLDRRKKLGFAINLLYSDNKETSYNTINNKLVFYRNIDTKDRQHQRVRARLRLLYRSSIVARHEFESSFLFLQVSDTLRRMNPEYFLHGQRVQRSINLRYVYERDQRDIWAYPLSGYWTRIELRKRGLGIFKDLNQFNLIAALSYHIPLADRFSASFFMKGQIDLIRNKTPYYNQRALGYEENFVRGYEYYVINGQDYLLMKGELNIKLFDFKIPLFKRIQIEYLRRMPIKIHLRTFFDFGYVWDRYYTDQNALTNTDMIGTGLGLDLVFYYYNIILRFDYSFNKLGEHGFYFSYKFNF